jgi:hypothetical protein
MSATTLVIVTWLAGLGPQVSLHGLADATACRAALGATEQMLRQQALANFTAPHRELQAVAPVTPDEIALRTPIGREVARLQCVPTTPADRP